MGHRRIFSHLFSSSTILGFVCPFVLSLTFCRSILLRHRVQDILVLKSYSVPNLWKHNLLTIHHQKCDFCSTFIRTNILIRNIAIIYQQSTCSFGCKKSVDIYSSFARGRLISTKCTVFRSITWTQCSLLVSRCRSCVITNTTRLSSRTENCQNSVVMSKIFLLRYRIFVLVTI